MELGVINERKNPLFSRKEIEFSVEAESVPSREEIRKSISEKFSVDLGAIKIKGIYGGFGSKNFKVKANVYKTKEDLEKVERKFKKDAKGEASVDIVESESVAEDKSAEETKVKSEVPTETPVVEVKETEVSKEEVVEEKPADTLKGTSEKKEEVKKEVSG